MRGGISVSRPWARAIAPVLIALLLAGCASLSREDVFSPVQETARDLSGKDVQWVRSVDEQAKTDARVSGLLEKPLGVEEAVQVALLNNKGLQASFEELGLASADLMQAQRLPNPGFSMLHTRHGDEYKIEQIVTFNIMSLVTMPIRVKMEQRRWFGV